MQPCSLLSEAVVLSQGRSKVGTSQVSTPRWNLVFRRNIDPTALRHAERAASRGPRLALLASYR